MCKSASPVLVPSPTEPPSRMTKPELLVRTEPLSASLLAELRLGDNATAVELSAGDELYGLVCAHIVSTNPRSYRLEVGNGRKNCRGCCDSSDEDDDEELCRVAKKGLGLGSFSFAHDGATIHAVHQTLGEVVGTNCGASLLRTLVLVSADGIGAITSLCDALIARADATSSTRFNIFRWHVQYNFWQKSETAVARSVESVVLPTELKTKLVDDLTDFVSKDTKAWYTEHGVPYKRSYLLHGRPGAGKTSLIQALAGRFGRNVCYLSALSHPEMTDDGLKAAVQRCPAKSILVLEDVDALFEVGAARAKKAGDKSALTFSGLLNALDGVGGSSGQVFILTTNHRERLDPALIRNGRVDVHVQFDDATPEQMRLLFSQFYKGAEAGLAEAFEEGLVAALGGKAVSMAQLQAYFIAMRKEGAEAASKAVGKVLEEMEAHGMGGGEKKEEAKDHEKEEEAKEEKKEEKEEEEGGKGKKGGGKKGGGGGGKEFHVHVHVD